MRKFFVAVLLLSATAASAEGVNERAHQLPQSPDSTKNLRFADTSSPRQASFWSNDELLGDTLGKWLGVQNGRWDLFNETLALSGEDGPTIAGTIRKNAAEIQLRWRPGQ